MGRKIKSGKGDQIRAPGALDQQIETANTAKSRAEPRQKSKRAVDEAGPGHVDQKLSAKILKSARKQLEDENEIEPESSKRMRHLSLGANSQADSDADDDHISDNDDYDENVVQLDIKDEMELQRFMVKKESQMSFYDLIQEKIEKKRMQAENEIMSVAGDDFEVRDLDPEVVEMYREVGQVLSKYRSGKLPKAFKYIPNMINWEQILYLTDPDNWSAAAMYQATRLFASNLNPRMCQRFYNLILLPRLRDDIDEFKKLNFHLFQALMKALYKPAAFFKGIILPLCESGTCTLREAVIFSSVLQKASIPIFHAAAAMLKISEMEYTGASSMFLRVLIDKKYALPYRAIDAMCSHFVRFKKDERELPVLWHQALLAFVQRYKKDLNEQQKKDIHDLVKVHFHYAISPEIRRELSHAGDVEGGDFTEGDIMKDGVGEASSGVKVVASKPRNDTMEF